MLKVLANSEILAFKGLMAAENDDSKSKMEDYEVMELIGRGSFGTTFRVLHKSENKKYILKKIHLSKQPEKFRSKAFQEMNLIAKLRHPYVLEYKESWVEKGSCICIVTNYCEGNLSDLIRKARGAYFSEEKLCKWLTQLLLAIDYLHSNRVLHRDLKLSNIFVTKESNILLGDFGLAKLLHEEGLASSVVGTPNYMCPELLENIPYGYKSDIWSLGCCMFEIAAHKQAFRAPDMTGLINKINRSLISPMPIVYSSTLKQIIKSMLRKSPEHRPTAAELLRHPHLQPFLLRCHNPSTVFLPVKSPSPNNGKEKVKTPSPISSNGENDSREKAVKPKKRELLPLFDGSSDMPYPSLLDGDALIEDLLETKRVDPTSYSGKISHDSEDSKSGVTCEMTAGIGDDHDSYEFSSAQESVCTTKDLARPNRMCGEREEFSAARENEKTMDEEPLRGPELNEERGRQTLDIILDKCSEMTVSNAVCSDNVVSHPDECVPLTNNNMRTEVDGEPRISSNVQTEVAESCTDKDTAKIKEDALIDEREIINDLLLKTQATVNGDGSNGKNEGLGQHRADALESLLELCARLLKQDKFDELSGVLKAFGEDTVSSRETAIWLTKSLINAQKLAKDS